MIRRIVYATDFSKASQRAFTKALELAKANRAALQIVHVMSPVVPMTGDGYITPSTFEALERSGRAWAQKQMDRLLDKARAARVKVDGKVLEGLAHEQIVRAARSADLLVLGTHGRTGVARFFLGSVAGRVAATAKVPVLTVRGG